MANEQDVNNSKAPPDKHNEADEPNRSPSSAWTVESALSTFPHRPTPSQPSPVPFFHLLARLKTTKREGWRRFGITSGESISDHMYRMALITMLCPTSLTPRLNLSRCTRLALIHDLAEALVGDITPVDGISKAEKSRREAAAVEEYICRDLLGAYDGGAQAKEIAQLWREYEDNESLEARFVHDVDKMELLLQTVEYEHDAGGKLDLSEFMRAADKVVLPEVKGWCEDVLREREEYWKGTAGAGAGVGAGSAKTGSG